VVILNKLRYCRQALLHWLLANCLLMSRYFALSCFFISSLDDLFIVPVFVSAGFFSIFIKPCLYIHHRCFFLFWFIKIILYCSVLLALCCHLLPGVPPLIKLNSLAMLTVAIETPCGIASFHYPFWNLRSCYDLWKFFNSHTSMLSLYTFFSNWRLERMIEIAIQKLCKSLGW